MPNKTASLREITSLLEDPGLSENYVRYLCDIRAEKDYRHHEVQNIADLLSRVHVPEKALCGFIFGYEVSRLNKEFDLLKITAGGCLNIELKNGEISEYRIGAQLRHNRHYLKLLQKKLYQFTFVSVTNRVFTLNEQGDLVSCGFSELEKVWGGLFAGMAEPTDLDAVFAPENILISPLNSTERFLAGEYLLTGQQETIRKQILEVVCKKKGARFFALTGGPGTGKTLLLYDLARTLSGKYRILVVHGGPLCEGHRLLQKGLTGVHIINQTEITSNPACDLVIVDEAQRLSFRQLAQARRWAESRGGCCVFACDDGQALGNANQSQALKELCGQNIAAMSGRFRVNTELSSFVSCLFDLKEFRASLAFPNVRILYEPNSKAASEAVNRLTAEGYEYIAPSAIERVIGQEFDSVAMVMGSEFRYGKTQVLESRVRSGAAFSPVKTLYQGLTRARRRIALVIISKDVLRRVLPLVNGAEGK